MKQKMSKKILVLAVFLLAINFVFSSALPVLGANEVDDLWGGRDAKQYIIENSGLPAEPNNDPATIVVRIIRFILGFLGLLAVMIVLYAGFKWMTSGGNEDKVSEAKKMLIAGVIGLVIILFAFALASFVINQIVEVTRD